MLQVTRNPAKALFRVGDGPDALSYDNAHARFVKALLLQHLPVVSEGRRFAHGEIRAACLPRSINALDIKDAPASGMGRAGINTGRDYSTCAQICCVYVYLNKGEKYQTTEMYNGRKETVEHAWAAQGKCTLWDAMQQVYNFTEPLEKEHRYCEIVLIRKGRPEQAFSLWHAKCAYEDLDYFFKNKNWTREDGTPGVRPGDTIEIRIAMRDTRHGPDAEKTEYARLAARLAGKKKNKHAALKQSVPADIDRLCEFCEKHLRNAIGGLCEIQMVLDEDFTHRQEN